MEDSRVTKEPPWPPRAQQHRLLLCAQQWWQRCDAAATVGAVTAALHMWLCRNGAGGVWDVCAGSWAGGDGGAEGPALPTDKGRQLAGLWFTTVAMVGDPDEPRAVELVR